MYIYRRVGPKAPGTQPQSFTPAQVELRTSASFEAYTRKTSKIAVSERAMTVVSSAYRETRGKGVETSGSRKPGMALLVRRLAARASIDKT